MLYGGEIQHSCNVQRSIGYYLEVLICLAPFTKQMLRATLNGVTSDNTDPSVCFELFVEFMPVLCILHVIMILSSLAKLSKKTLETE